MSEMTQVITVSAANGIIHSGASSPLMRVIKIEAVNVINRGRLLE